MRFFRLGVILTLMPNGMGPSGPPTRCSSQRRHGLISTAALIGRSGLPLEALDDRRVQIDGRDPLVRTPPAVLSAHPLPASSTTPRLGAAVRNPPDTRPRP